MAQCPQCRADNEPGARFCPYCGAAAAPERAEPADPYVGRTVNGKFRVEALLGQGGMGRVYKATHLTLDRPVVLKMLHRAFSSDPQVTQRFHREAKAASRLNHPNSIAVLDFGEAEDGTLFMAMEYLAGRDLAQIIVEEYPLAEPRIVRIGAQILSALAEAHAHGIIHRDLKPENVMVEPRRDAPDHVKVLDFGIAKISDPGPEEPRLTQAGLVCGTPEYMSPEQARGRELDARSDLYSVGVILYQMVTGRLPFESETPVGYLTKHLSEPPIPLRERAPGVAVSPALEALIARALAKAPAQRPASADDMREALLACASTTPVRPDAASSPTAFAIDVVEPSPERKRGRAGALVAVVAVVAAIAVGGGYWVKRGPPQAAAPIAPAVAPPHPGPLPGGEGTVPSPSLSPTSPTTTTGVAPPHLDPLPGPAPRKPDRARAVALYERAEARRAEQDPDGAIRLYLAAEAADPTLHPVQKKLALCYQLKGDKRRAVERYRKYLASRPDDADRVKAILAALR